MALLTLTLTLTPTLALLSGGDGAASCLCAAACALQLCRGAHQPPCLALPRSPQRTTSPADCALAMMHFLCASDALPMRLPTMHLPTMHLPTMHLPTMRLPTMHLPTMRQVRTPLASADFSFCSRLLQHALVFDDEGADR